jgi:hypothetical protein
LTVPYSQCAQQFSSAVGKVFVKAIFGEFSMYCQLLSDRMATQLAPGIVTLNCATSPGHGVPAVGTLLLLLRSGLCPQHMKADAMRLKGGGDQRWRFCQQVSAMCLQAAAQSCSSNSFV